MFGIGYVNRKVEPCTPEKLAAALDSPVVRNVCAFIRRLVEERDKVDDEGKRKEYDERIAQAKRTLPCITPMAHFKENKRSDKNAIPSGLNMLDIDHVDDPRNLTPALSEGEGDKSLTIGGFEVVLVHVTPSTRGLRVIFKQPAGMGIAEAQAQLASAMKVPFDSVTKDYARCSFLVPRDYVLYMDEKRLFDPLTTQGGTINSDTETSNKYEQDKKQDSNTEDAPKTDGASQTKLSTETPPSGDGGLETFKSIPYSEIIKAILFSAGYNETPAVGERNSALYMLVRNLRYVCDFDTDQIIKVLPDWGLPEREVRSTVESAVKSVRMVMMPTQLQNIIDALAKNYQKLSEQGYDETWDYIVQPEGLIGDIVNMQPVYLRNAAYIAAMCCFGTLLTRLRGYGLNGKLLAPNFMVCIQAPQAAGKSFMKDIYSIITKPIFKNDERLRKELREINKENRRNKDKDGYEEEEFNGDIRLLPTNTSNRILVERTDKAKKQHLLIMAEEIDSITKAEKTGKWSEKSDIYRLAFDNSLWGMDYANENAYTSTVPLYLNLLFSGTPVSVGRFFNDIENGLVTRFLFCDLPDNLGKKRPKNTKYDAAYIKSIDDRIQGIYEQMKDFTEESFEIEMDTTQMCKDVEELYEEPQRIQYLCNQSDPCRAIVYRRYSIYAVLFMMIETWLNGGVYTESIRDRVINTINYCTEQLIALYGDEMNKSLECVNEKHQLGKTRSHKLDILGLVENTFTSKDYEKALLDAGIDSNFSGSYLTRLVDGKIIERISRGIYRKLLTK